MKKLISQLTIAAALTASLAGSTATPANAGPCGGKLQMFFYFVPQEVPSSSVDVSRQCATAGESTFVYVGVVSPGATYGSARYFLGGVYGKAYSWQIYHATSCNPDAATACHQGGGEITVPAPASGYTLPTKQTQRIESTAGVGGPAASSGAISISTPRVALNPTAASVTARFRDPADGYALIEAVSYNKLN